MFLAERRALVVMEADMIKVYEKNCSNQILYSLWYSLRDNFDRWIKLLMVCLSWACRTWVLLSKLSNWLNIFAIFSLRLIKSGTVAGSYLKTRWHDNENCNDPSSMYPPKSFSDLMDYPHWLQRNWLAQAAWVKMAIGFEAWALQAAGVTTQCTMCQAQ